MPATIRSRVEVIWKQERIEDDLNQVLVGLGQGAYHHVHDHRHRREPVLPHAKDHVDGERDDDGKGDAGHPCHKIPPQQGPVNLPGIISDLLAFHAVPPREGLPSA